MQHVFDVEGTERAVWLSRLADGYRLHLGETAIEVALADDHLSINGSGTQIHVAQDGDRLFIHLDGEAYELSFRDPVSLHAAGASGGAQDILRAPMPGVVVSCSVTPGEEVKEGDILLVIESMKLETALRAPRDGVVEAVHVAVSAGFERDAPLLSLASLDAGA